MHPQPDPLPPGRGGAHADAEETSHRIVTVDRGWRIESIHPEVLALLAVTERSVADLVGMVFWEGFPALAGTAAEQRLRAAMQHHASENFELHYPLSGVRVDVRARPHWPALSIYLRDITGTRPPAVTAGLRPRSSTEKPQIVDAAAPPEANLACAFDRDARLTHASAALLDRWGVRLQEAKGRTMLGLNYPQAVAERLHQHIKRVVATGQPLKDEITHAIREGWTEAHEHVFSPLFAPDGTVLGVAGAIRILAERKATARDAADPGLDAHVNRAKVLGEVAADFFSSDQSRLSLAALFERIATALRVDCFLYHRVAGGGGLLTLENSGGFDRERLVRFAEIDFGDGVPGIVAKQRQPLILEQVQKSRRVETAALRELGLDACVCHPLKTGDRLLGTFLLATGSRARFEEEELRFMQSAAALVSARLAGDTASAPSSPTPKSAARQEVLKEEFLHAVVQELRVPLESTLQQVRSIASNPAIPPEVRGELDKIAQNLITESRLVNDLLDLNRITRGELSIEQSVLNLHALVRDALASVKPDMAEHGIVLAMNLPDVAPLIRGDAVRLQQVFWNLLKRAVRSTPRGGVVSVRLILTPENMAAIAITDAGAGLAPDEAARVFEPWASDPAKAGEAASGQLGFGMATVRKIVELHAGHIRVVQPQSGQGTRFIVELPIVVETPPAERPGTDTRKAPPEDRPHSSKSEGGRILLVEEHPDTRNALLILLRQRRHEVVVATSVREARGLAAQHRFDLVLSAVNLPDGSGYELMAALRLDCGLSGIALIGNGTEHDLALARSAGFVARLTKPVGIEALERALAAHLPAR